MLYPSFVGRSSAPFWRAFACPLRFAFVRACLCFSAACYDVVKGAGSNSSHLTRKLRFAGFVHSWSIPQIFFVFCWIIQTSRTRRQRAYRPVRPTPRPLVARRQAGRAPSFREVSAEMLGKTRLLPRRS